MGATEKPYDWMWDLASKLHLRAHGESHARKFDFNCCDEWAALMAIRAVSQVRNDVPSYLLERLSMIDEVDREFYVENILSTDGEPEPTEDDAARREYRAVRRHRALWTELKEAAARIDVLEGQLRRRSEATPG